MRSGGPTHEYATRAPRQDRENDIRLVTAAVTYSGCGEHSRPSHPSPPGTPVVTRLRLFLALGCLIPLWVFSAGGQDKPRTGPETEKRFPPLKVPPGFKATLFACDPLIEYPSVIAAGPKANNLFVAIDYVTGLGEEIVRRDEIRLIEDTDGDGYADKSTVYAKGFNSIQGLAYHDGSVYVMHAPYLTVLRDTKGTGVADERRDLLKGLGLTPEVNKTRLHCANGVTVGHDGWLYLAMGDNGTDVKRPEGDRLVLHGGGILRCRPDGRDLHVFATGLRNIYDVALDAELNVFTRDNENDGGTYKIRVCHSFFGADHGYPYHYYERPDEAVPPIADLGLGSSAGGVSYLERGFPAEYRGNLFFCEWGRSVVRYVPKPAGSGFGPVKEIEFAVAAENDPYGFKPTDIVVQRDGALMIADWADGQRPKRGRGRIYRVTPTGMLKTIEKPATGLDSGSYYERCDTQLGLEKQGADGLKALRQMLADGKLGPRGRMHAVWIIAHNDGAKALDDLLAVAKLDPELSVRVQAVRVIADLTDPVLAKHKLDVGAGDATIAAKLAALGEGADARFQHEVVVALARLRWTGTPDWVAKHITKPDATLAHAAMQAMRQAGNWPAVLKLLDRPTDDALRSIALRAVADQHETAVVDGLIERLKAEKDAPRREAYADALSRVHRKPGPWVYWGYRPGPRPANTVDWDRTAAIAAALDGALADPDRGVRLAVLKRMQREKVPIRTAALTHWLRDERGEEVVAGLLESLSSVPASESRAALEAVVNEKAHGTANRLRALAILTAGFDATGANQLLPLAGSLEDGLVLAEVLRFLGKHPKLDGAAMLLASRTASKAAAVRAAAIEALAEIGVTEGKEPALKLLGDEDAAVRRAAAGAAGKLNVKAAVEPLLKLAKDVDAGVRAASLDALRRLKEPRVVPLAVAALDDRLTQLAALECLHALGGPEQGSAVAALARRAPPADVLAVAVRSLSEWSGGDGITPAKRRELESAIAEVHGATGTLLRWQVSRALTVKDADTVRSVFAPPGGNEGLTAPVAGWRSVLATGTEWRVNVGPTKGEAADAVWLAFADVAVPEAVAVEFTGSGGALEVWLNGKSLYRVEKLPDNRNAPVRFAGELAKGNNRVLVRVGSSAAEFSMSFRRKSSTAAHEKLTQAALTRTGDVERGRKVFLNAEKSLCVKCHRVGEQGERIGPELTGIGARFGRVYLVESILDPNRAVVPGFATLRLELKDGRVFTGVKASETDTTLTLADNEAKKHELKKADIQEQRPVGVSTMPDGAEKRMTEQEFIDLVAYLVSLKERKH
jgi:putative membrane-bound dehydrogenase-like protein